MGNENLIPGDAVQAIKDSEKTQVIKVGEVEFVTRHVFEPPREPTPASLELSTLTGLIDYVNDGVDGISDADEDMMIHVVDDDPRSESP